MFFVSPKLLFWFLKYANFRRKLPLFTTKSPEVPGTRFIDRGRMKGYVNLSATQWFSTRDETQRLGIQRLNHRPLHQIWILGSYKIEYSDLHQVSETVSLSM